MIRQSMGRFRGGIDRCPPVLGGGLVDRCTTGQLRRSIEIKYASRKCLGSAYDENKRSTAKITDCHLVCMIPRERVLTRLVRPPRMRVRKPFASLRNDELLEWWWRSGAPVMVLALGLMLCSRSRLEAVGTREDLRHHPNT
jgi:hypothetical protein